MNFDSKLGKCGLIISIISLVMWQSRPVSGDCNGDETKRCVVLSQCPSMLKLLQPPVNFDNLKILQEATCDSQNAEPKVCCEGQKEEEKPSGSTNRPPPSSSAGDLTRKILDHPNLSLLPDSRSCGISNPVEPPTRLVGGTDAGLGTYPWMTLIGFKLTSDPKIDTQFACGASLINSRYVLTAAHCVTGLPAGFVVSLIRVGEYNQSATLDCVDDGVCAPKTQDIHIQEVISHEDYDKTKKKENDIALIRLKKHVALGPFVSPICLPHGDKLQKVSNRPVVAGWGRTIADNPDNANILQHVNIPFQSMDKCNEFYESALGRTVDEGRFCAGGEKGKDSCKGDSGGPLMLRLKAKGAGWQLRLFQLGIVSVGPKDCGGSAYPALYTKVSQFMPWILDHLRP